MATSLRYCLAPAANTAIGPDAVSEDDAWLGLICHLLASLQRERETPNAIRWPKSFKNVEDEARFELDDPGVSVEVSLWIWQACERRMVAQVEESLAGYLLLPTVRDLG